VLTGGTEIISSGGIYSSTIVSSRRHVGADGRRRIDGHVGRGQLGRHARAGSGFTLGGTFATIGEILQIQSSGAYSG